MALSVLGWPVVKSMGDCFECLTDVRVPTMDASSTFWEQRVEKNTEEGKCLELCLPEFISPVAAAAYPLADTEPASLDCLCGLETLLIPGLLFGTSYIGVSNVDGRAMPFQESSRPPVPC